MVTETFFRELAQKIELPFAIEEVEEIEENAGITWVILKSGKVYSVSIIECEDEQ